ncbi:MFS transporter [Arthrobacter oryzae]|uniref:Sugar phosphate permease n=1 Tax=Arthrobacter oryzae TaxID=409290 RepID=A0A495EPX5_9MICC|nr:MFS transporter [Arthrobacter oryzae]RKR18964.1 sugar phosphate permease [Arthrobacter oryzae]
MRRHPRWGAVVGFGLVSLATDMVSDGARPLGGPLLAQLGATALFVGLVTGAAEAAAQGLRLVFGPWADRTGKYWTFTMAGYALTAVCVPLLALTPLAGSAGLALAAVLIIGDRVGKAVRSPAKTVLLAAVAGPVGRGRGFAVHKSLDLAGALLGPLLVTGVLVATGSLSAAFAVLVVPAVTAVAILVWLRRRIKDPGADTAAADAGPAGLPASETAASTVPEPVPDSTLNSAPGSAATGAEPGRGKTAGPPASGLSGVFLLFALAAFFWSAGLVAFGVISYHLTADVAVPVPVVPLLYAGAMGAAAVGALVSGVLYDRAGAAVLFALPVLIAGVPVLALAPNAGLVLAGVLVWGAATGIQDSTVKALVADLVPQPRQGTAYGVFAAFEGAGALVGGALYGSLYGAQPVLIGVVAALQIAALVLLVVTLRRARPSAGRGAAHRRV